jgi:ACS family tartrate transporter-like MFS transporter
MVGLEVQVSNPRDEEDLNLRQTMRKVDRHLIPWFFALGVCCYLDRTNLSFAAVQLSADLGLSCATYGLGAGLFFLGYSFQVPSTMMAARFGAPLWLVITVVAWALVAFAFAATTGTVMFLVLRIALGLAECGTFPTIWLHLSKFYTERELGAAYASVATSTALAQVVGAPLAAGILSLNGVFGIRGWRWLFLVEGAITVIFGVLLGLNLAPSPRDASFLHEVEREWLANRQDRQRTANLSKSFAGQLESLIIVLKNWRVWYMSAIWFTVTQSMYGIIFFAPLMIRDMFASPSNQVFTSLDPKTPSGEFIYSNSTMGRGKEGTGCSGEVASHDSGALVALLSVVPFAAAATAMVINAKLAERANERHRHAGVPICLGALSMGLAPVMLTMVGSPLGAFVCLVLAATFVWSFHGPFMSWPAAFLDGDAASTGFAFINSLGSLGGFVGPFLLGYLADKSGGYGIAMLVLGAMLALGGVAILLFPVHGCDVKMVDLSEMNNTEDSPKSQEQSPKAQSDGERVPMLTGLGGERDLNWS